MTQPAAWDRETVARIVYEAMRKHNLFPTPEWVPGGNALAQDTARRAADQICALYPSAPAPTQEDDETRALNAMADEDTASIGEFLREAFAEQEKGALEEIARLKAAVLVWWQSGNDEALYRAVFGDQSFESARASLQESVEARLIRSMQQAVEIDAARRAGEGA